MGLKVITPPAIEPLTMQEAADYLRIDNVFDPILPSLITQAREFCEDYQKKKYITQILELVLDRFPKTNYIEFTSTSPVQSITSIKYYDKDGTEHVVSSNDYILDNDSFVHRVFLKYLKLWPLDILQPYNAVRIRFVTGYGTASDVPESVKQAMVLQMKLLYDDYKPDEREKLEEARNALLGMRRVVNA
jgi:uncharacterized phiE125 gp8 family phage protein